MPGRVSDSESTPPDRTPADALKKLIRVDDPFGAVRWSYSNPGHELHVLDDTGELPSRILRMNQWDLTTRCVVRRDLRRALKGWRWLRILERQGSHVNGAILTPHRDSAFLVVQTRQ